MIKYDQSGPYFNIFLWLQATWAQANWNHPAKHTELAARNHKAMACRQGLVLHLIAFVGQNSLFQSTNKKHRQSWLSHEPKYASQRSSKTEILRNLRNQQPWKKRPNIFHGLNHWFFRSQFDFTGFTGAQPPQFPAKMCDVSGPAHELPEHFAAADPIPFAAAAAASGRSRHAPPVRVKSSASFGLGLSRNGRTPFRWMV